MVRITRYMFVSFALLIGVTANGQQRITPQKVADAMIAAFDDQLEIDDKMALKGMVYGMNHFSAAENGQILSTSAEVVTYVSAFTGEKFPDEGSIGITLYSWLANRMRNRFAAGVLKKYEARIKAIERQTLNDWHAALTKLEPAKQRGLLVLAIAFQDAFWIGSNWKLNHPRRTIALLNALSKAAVTRWKEMFEIDTGQFFMANSLVAVDDLFKGEALKLDLFDRALPLVKKRIEAYRKEK